MCRRVGGISPLTSKSWCWEISGFWLGGKFGPPPRGGFLYNYETNEAKIMAINDTRNYCVHVVQDLCILVTTLCDVINACLKSSLKMKKKKYFEILENLAF